MSSSFNKPIIGIYSPITAKGGRRIRNIKKIMITQNLRKINLNKTKRNKNKSSRYR